jgi:hypothetical protein
VFPEVGVCFIATNVAPRELLWRPNRWTRFGVGARSFLQLDRSDAMAPRTHAWCPGRSSELRFYSTNQKSSVAIFIGKPIPRPDRFLSSDRPRQDGTPPANAQSPPHLVHLQQPTRPKLPPAASARTRSMRRLGDVLSEDHGNRRAPARRHRRELSQLPVPAPPSAPSALAQRATGPKYS